MTNNKIEDLFELYNHLTVPSGTGDLYTARAINGHPRCRIAKDPQGNPALLFTARTVSRSIVDPPFDLRNLSFLPRCVCRVQVQDERESLETLAVLKCLSEDQMLRQYFLRSMSGFISTLPIAPTEGDVAVAVRKLVDLFRALEAPARKSLQGIWCELFLISRSHNIRQVATAWHPDPHALYDFVAGLQRVEVKSCSNSLRAHYFSLDQLLPPRGNRYCDSFVRP